jgi:nicotinamide-nucleotide amidase
MKRARYLRVFFCNSCGSYFGIGRQKYFYLRIINISALKKKVFVLTTINSKVLMPLNRRLIKIMQAKNLTLAFAESMTCGLAAYQLSSVKGTTDVLQGSIVCYHENVKKDCLKIPGALIKKFTAESQEVTDALAKKLQSLIEANVYAAVTGLASDGGSERPGKPVGSVFMSVVFEKKIFRKRKIFKGPPQEIKEKACAALYQMIIDIVN